MEVSFLKAKQQRHPLVGVDVSILIRVSTPVSLWTKGVQYGNGFTGTNE